MTTVTVTTEVPPRAKTEGDSVSYGSSSAHIIEETEYVKEIRSTLEKIRNHMFKDEEGHNNANYKVDAEPPGNMQNGSDSTADHTCLDLLMENMRRKDQQLLEMNRENEMLKIKLEASREAGAATLRNVAQRLFDNYQMRSEDMKKKHEDSKRLLQINNLEKEQTLKHRAENLSQLSEKLEEKHVQIIGLENRVQRMENEKKTLLERKLCLENKLLQLKSNDAHSKSCQGLQTEISILQEQICHLQFVIHSQHQSLRNIIQEMEGLKNTLKEQDKKIENLKEKVYILESQNKELKTKVARWTDTPKTSLSKAVSTGVSAEDPAGRENWRPMWGSGMWNSDECHHRPRQACLRVGPSWKTALRAKVRSVIATETPGRESDLKMAPQAKVPAVIATETPGRKSDLKTAPRARRP